MAERVPLPLRIVVEDPVPGVFVALQRGATAAVDHVPPVVRSARALIFDFEVAVEGALEDGCPRLLGRCVQGPPPARFAYLCIGAPWSRRAKVPLGGITAAQIAALSPGERLCAHVNGRARDGTPACASVPLIGGWTAITPA